MDHLSLDKILSYIDNCIDTSYRKEIEKIKKVDLNWSKDRIERHIRATYMTGFEPPYMIINNQKVYFGKE